MDKLSDTISNMTMYDVKAYVRKAQNAVMNFTEMEAKVREATNNEPWGASSTVMQEIADGTNSYSQFHEIMPMIYKRFTEKSAEEWRQIYKALQLLEFLVKNGSERVVDYARSHSAVIDMLKHFHYIDQNGKDQGINIRNRAKELTMLLSDVERIRTERRKAKSNKTKYEGMGNGGLAGPAKSMAGLGLVRWSLAGVGMKTECLAMGGGFNGSNYSGPGYSNNDDEFEEYEVESSSSSSRPRVKTETKPVEPAPVQDMISFDDDEFGAPQQATSTTKPAADNNDDDEFDDFQSASGPSTASTKDQITDLFSSQPAIQSPQPQQPVQNNNLLGGLSMQPQQAPPLTSPGSAMSNPMAFKSSVNTPTSSMMSNASSTSLNSSTTTTNKKKDDAFGSLWSAASAKSAAAGKSKPKQQDFNKTSLSSLQQQSVQNSMWGQPQSQSQSQPQGDDLLSFD